MTTLDPQSRLGTEFTADSLRALNRPVRGVVSCGRWLGPTARIGASAGGLEAFSQLLKALPLDTRMGLVLVQHLDPEHESALAQILSRATSLPVVEITNNQPVEPITSTSFRATRT